MRLSRRALVLGTLASSAAHAEPDPEDVRNLKVLELVEEGRRFLLLTPRWQQPDEPVPLVVFLHGLGETGDPRLGAHAWLERYGLGSAWQRLKRPPIERTSTRGEWTDPRLAEINAELAARPFRGFAMACPHMPNLHGAAEVDAYARWVASALVPRCRKEANVIATAERTYLCGVSLGGWASLELLVRLPDVFGAWAGLQTAIGTWAAPGYAARIARGSPPAANGRTPHHPLLVLTSTLDHWRTSSEALVAALAERSVAHDFRIVPGPHDQPWLREAGTIEALHWLDRLA